MPDWGVDSREVWVNEQLEKVNLPDTVTGPVTQLMKCWWAAHFPIDKTEQILNVFTELAQDHSLEVPDDHFDWVEVRPGYIKVTDIVRVRSDAYKGGIGKEHNGRMGRVVAIRSGDIIIKSIDEGAPFDGVHHSPYALEKRV